MMINTYRVITLILSFYLLLAKISTVRIEGISSFGNEQKTERVFNMYKKSPPSNFYFSDIFDSKESTENVEERNKPDPISEKSPFRMNPFFTQYQYTHSSPRHPSPVIRPPNDILLIVTNPPDGNCSIKNSNNDSTASSKVMYGGVNHYSKLSPPSKCVWAIVACCAPTSQYFRYSCFNFLECTGAFWYFNPCQLSVMIASAEEALKYYQQFQPLPKPTTETPINNGTTAIPTTSTVTTETTTQTNQDKATVESVGEST